MWEKERELLHPFKNTCEPGKKGTGDGRDIGIG